MNAVRPKGGLSNTFFGSVFGVAVLVFVQIISAAISGNDVKVVPTLTFDKDPIKFVGDYLAYFFTTLPGLIALIITILCYIAATYYVQKSKPPLTAPSDPPQEHDTSGTMRGWIIGMTAGLNFILAYNIYGGWFSETIGLIFALVFFILGILATFRAVSQNGAYQAVIGWICWLAPMSWLVFLLGLILFVLSWIGALIGLANVDVFKIRGENTAGTSTDASVQGKIFSVDWATGTFFLIGGIVANLNPEKTAFNMGNIGFIHRKATDDHRKHEAGHNLNLFVYGWIVHLIGAVDENIVGYREKAITERMAESHDTSTSRAKLEVWN